MESYFENIKSHIIAEVNSAEFIMHIAVAWITDHQIINALINKIKQGVQIELIINNDGQFEKNMSIFNELRNHGGKLYLYNNDNRSIMHNKFCIIDLSTIITGSFNWSFSASAYHKENIIIVRDDLVTAKQYAREFSKIKRSSILFESKYIPYDSATYAQIVEGGYLEGINDAGDEFCYYEANLYDNGKFGTIYIEMGKYGLKLKDIPNELFGVWTELLNPEPHAHHIIGTVHYYRFVCLDPRVIKYVL